MKRMVITACAIAAASLLLLLLAGPSYQAGLLSLPAAFTVLRWAAYVGLAAIAAGSGAALWTYRRRALVPFALSVVALIAAAVSVAVPAGWQWIAGRVPAIYDVSTDLENPPVFEAVLSARDATANPIERTIDLDDRQRTGYPDIAPVTLAGTTDQVFDRALAVAQDNGWSIVTADKATGRIEATATSRWFGFTDDVVVRLTPWGAGTRIDVRSVSRVGTSDYGSNARRIRRFLGAMQAT